MSTAPKITKREIMEAYDQDFAVSDHLRETDAHYRWVLGKLKPRSGTRLLDVACGMGLLVRYAQELGVETYGIDLSRTAVCLTRKESPRTKVTVGDGENLPFPSAYFDYITNLGSLEHFLKPEQGLAEMLRVMKPGALAAIYLPNSYYLVDIFWRVMRTGYGVTHRQVLERFATYNEWGDFLKGNGFEIVKGYNYNPLFPKTMYDWKFHWKHPRRIFLTLAAPFIPFHLSFHFLYICKKAPQ